LGRSDIRGTNPKPDTDALLKNTDWETSPDPIRYLISPCSIYPLSDERVAEDQPGAGNNFYALNGYERVLASLVSSALGSPLVIAIDSLELPLAVSSIQIC